MVNNISLYHIFVLWYRLKASGGNRCLGKIFWLYSYSWNCLQDLILLISGELSVLGHGVCSSGVQGSMSYCPMHQSTEFCLKSS